MKPYGDSPNDGAMQLSFTLPIPYGPVATEAAKILCIEMKLEDIQVVHMQRIDADYTFFVVYGRSTVDLDTSMISPSTLQVPKLTMGQINELARGSLGKKIKVVGACTGTDAHTLGLDAILNMKGFHGNPGLEAYSEFSVFNLGSQVENAALVAKARGVGADAILVSQVITHKTYHIQNLTNLVDLVEAEGMRDEVILIVGGPRITHELAVELGFDAGFGAGTMASDVGSFLVQELAARLPRQG